MIPHAAHRPNKKRLSEPGTEGTEVPDGQLSTHPPLWWYLSVCMATQAAGHPWGSVCVCARARVCVCVCVRVRENVCGEGRLMCEYDTCARTRTRARTQTDTATHLVNLRLVLDVLSAVRIAQCGERLIIVPVSRAHVGHHDRLGVAAKGVLCVCVCVYVCVRVCV